MNESSMAESWCTDGVTNLTLARQNPVSINAVGAIVWFCDGTYVALFECDFYFNAPNDPVCNRIIVRFRKRDARGELERLPYAKHLDRAGVVASRPRSNRGWAFAVELS